MTKNLTYNTFCIEENGDEKGCVEKIAHKLSATETNLARYQHDVQLFLLTGTFNVQCEFRFVNNGVVL
uniref:AraC family transcriptional regulator n=1 Tax=Romanomermis culicivorax TaxID=13658 RepID=A0A915HGA7_ROMCU